MKFSGLKYILLILFVCISAIEICASNYYYYKVNANPSPTGCGKVYVTTNDGGQIRPADYKDSFSETFKLGSSTGNAYIHATTTQDFNVISCNNRSVLLPEKLKVDLSSSSEDENNPEVNDFTVQFDKTHVTVSNPYPDFCTVAINPVINKIGDQVTASVTMKSGATFVGWHRSDQAQIASTNTSYSFTVDSPINLEPVITLNQSTAKGFSRIIDATNTDSNSLLTLIDDNFNYTQVVTAIGGLKYFDNQEKLALGRAKACEFIQKDFDLQTDCSDAGGVIYIDKNNNIYAQGTSLYYVTDGYTCTTSNVPNVHIGGFNSTLNQTGEFYNISVHVQASVSGYTLDIGNVYLGRNENAELDVTTESKTDGSQNWRIEQLDNEKQFFVKPQLVVDGKYYATLRTAFSYTVKHPDKVNVFMVTATDDGVAILQQFNEGDIIPPALPVVIQCETNNEEDNVLIPVAPLFDAKYKANNTILYNKYGYRQHDYYCTGTQSNNNIDSRTEDGIGYFKVKYTKANTVPIYKLSVNEDGEVGFWTKVGQDEVISGNEAYSYTPCALFPRVKTPLIELDKTEANVGENIQATITTATSGATIYYSLDDGASWTEYTEPVAITKYAAGAYNIKAKATKNCYLDSHEAKANYTFNRPEFADITLAELIESGDTEGKYNITDVWAKGVEQLADGKLITCKDQKGYTPQDAMPNPIPENETWVDYMQASSATIQSDLDYSVPETYDQSNWIVLRMPEDQKLTGDAMTTMKNCRLTNVKGRLVDAVNPEFQLETVPTPVLGEKDESALNVFVAASFGGTQQSTVNGRHYFFVQPKPMERAYIGWAQWDGEKFVAPVANDYNPGWNQAKLNGEFAYNSLYQTWNAEVPEQDHIYKMEGLVKLAVPATGRAPRRAQGDAKSYEVYPLYLTKTSTVIDGVITGVAGVTGSHEVAGVDYINLAGQRSSRPWQGVNIVVTRYTDGTIQTQKQVH